MAIGNKDLMSLSVLSLPSSDHIAAADLHQPFPIGKVVYAADAEQFWIKVDQNEWTPSLLTPTPSGNSTTTPHFT